MNPVFQKLNFKDHAQILILNAPVEFRSTLDEMRNLTAIDETLDGSTKYDFILIFVKTCEEIRLTAAAIQHQLGTDVTLWYAYPKKSSKRYKSNISRDDGWQPLGELGFEAVRQVAIDDDWSALRMREAKYIKSMQRDSARAMSKEGKSRT